MWTCGVGSRVPPSVYAFLIVTSSVKLFFRLQFTREVNSSSHCPELHVVARPPAPLALKRDKAWL